MRKTALAATVLAGLTGCTFVNFVDNERYRVLTEWPPVCRGDGSVVLLQKANSSASFNDPAESNETCTNVENRAWTYREEMDRTRDYRLLGK